jgi:glutathione S-transferase
MSEHPILYSFRRCPYAIRARMALAYSGIAVELREVHLKHKPAAMLEASAKGTVPVLQLPGGRVLDESLAVMRWSLDHADPDHWLLPSQVSEDEELIRHNDGPFKASLDLYKYADRHPEQSQASYREQAMPFLHQLNGALERNRWLLGPQMRLADVALFPFIRQFAMVDRPWFDAAPLDALGAWLDRLLEMELFKSIMLKTEPWVKGQAPVILNTG